VTFLAGWNVRITGANELTTLQYIDEILLPYVKQKRQDLQLPDNLLKDDLWWQKIARHDDT